jgi:hypothetical protein
MQRYFDVVQNRQGTAVVGATVTVYDSNGNLATLYSNNSGTAPSSNPVYTNADGEYVFYAANGIYTIQIAATGYAGETKPGVVLFDPSDSGASNNVQFLQAGTGAQVRSVQSKLRDVVSELDYNTFTNARNFANSAALPLLTSPTVNLVNEPPLGGGAAPTNGYLRKGFMSGHLAIGNGPLGIDACVGLLGDEYYLNVEQEIRGVSYVVRNTRTTPDEPTLGWDFFGVAGIVTVEPQNTQNLIGNHKAVTGELYFNAPLSGGYSVLTAHNFQAASTQVGANVTITKWYGLVVNSPAGAGNITTGYGIYIEPITLPTTKAAIKIDGTANAGRILWTNSSITESSTGQLGIDFGTTEIKEDVSGKLEINLNNQQAVLTNALVATTVGSAGGASALPATPQGYLRVLIGGIERKIPYYTA